MFPLTFGNVLSYKHFSQRTARGTGGWGCEITGSAKFALHFMAKRWISSFLNTSQLPLADLTPSYSKGQPFTSLAVSHHTSHSVRSRHLRDAIDWHLSGLQDAGRQHSDQVEQHIRLLLKKLRQGALEGLRDNDSLEVMTEQPVLMQSMKSLIIQVSIREEGCTAAGDYTEAFAASMTMASTSRHWQVVVFRSEEYCPSG